MHVLVCPSKPEGQRFLEIESIQEAISLAHEIITKSADPNAAWIDPNPERCQVRDYLLAVNLNGFLAARLGDTETPWHRLDLKTLEQALGGPVRSAREIHEVISQPGLLEMLLERDDQAEAAEALAA